MLKKVLLSWKDTIGTRWGAFDSVVTRIRSEWCKLRDLISLCEPVEVSP